MSKPSFVLKLSCPNRPGHRGRRLDLPVRGGLQHPRRPAVRRRGDRPLLHARGVRPVAATTPISSAARAGSRAWPALRHGLDPARPRRAAARDAPGLEVRPLPGRPALSLAHRRTADGRRGHRLQPPAPRPTAHVDLDGLPFHHLPVTQADQAASRRRELWELDRGDRRRAGRARALHAGAVGRAGGEARRAAASTSTTPSCRASRAPSPITRPTRAA